MFEMSETFVPLCLLMMMTACRFLLSCMLNLFFLPPLLENLVCSKLREITGGGIFAADSENGASESGSIASNPNNKTGLRTYQVYQIK